MIKEFLKGEGDYCPSVVVICISLAALLGLACCNFELNQSIAGRKFVDNPELVYEFKDSTNNSDKAILSYKYSYDDINYYVDTDTGDDLTLPKKNTMLTEIRVFNSRKYKETTPVPGITYKFVGKSGEVYEVDSFVSSSSTFAIKYKDETIPLKRREYKVIKEESKDTEEDKVYRIEMLNQSGKEIFYAFSYAENDTHYIIKKDGVNKYIPKHFSKLEEIPAYTPDPSKDSNTPLQIVTDKGEVFEVKSYTEWLLKVINLQEGCSFKIISKEDK